MLGSATAARTAQVARVIVDPTIRVAAIVVAHEVGTVDLQLCPRAVDKPAYPTAVSKGLVRAAAEITGIEIEARWGGECRW